MENKMKKIKDKLIESGLCKKWQDRWDDNYTHYDIAGIAMTLEGIEFMREHRGVIYELMPEFCEYTNGTTLNIPNLGKGAMWIDRRESSAMDIDLDVIYLSNSSIFVRPIKNKVMKIICDNSSSLRIDVISNNVIFIELYDSSNVLITGTGTDNNIYVIRENDKCRVVSYLVNKDDNNIKINTR